MLIVNIESAAYAGNKKNEAARFKDSILSFEGIGPEVLSARQSGRCVLTEKT